MAEFSHRLPMNCVEKNAACFESKTLQRSSNWTIVDLLNITQHFQTSGLSVSKQMFIRLSIWRLLQYSAYTLPAAVALDLTLRPLSIVRKPYLWHRIPRKLPDRSLRCGNKSDSRNNDAENQSSSAPLHLNSSQSLMRSATDIWPGGLGSSSEN